MQYDLLLTSGHVIDPANSIDETIDIAVKNGLVACVSKDIPESTAEKIIDVSGLYLTPGLVDIHSHLYYTPGMKNAWAGDYSVPPDCFSFRSGITTMVDAGSAGWRNFEDFHNRVLQRAQTNLYAMINIVGVGMMTDECEQSEYDMNIDFAAGTAKEYADRIVGVKSAHYFGPEWTPIERAIRAGEASHLPVMIDVGYFRKERPYHVLVTGVLRAGDISTHMFRAPIPYINSNGGLYPYLHKARDRGVIFDVGHGSASLALRNAVPAIKLGFYPDTISSDLHVLSMNGPLIDMPTLLSKFISMGMPLYDVIKAATYTPAVAIGKRQHGHLSVGATADIAAFSLLKGEFSYSDSGGGKIDADSRLLCEMTIKNGTIVFDWNSRAAVPYPQLGDTYEVRDVDDIAVPDTDCHGCET